MSILTYKEVKKDFPLAVERKYAAGQIIIYNGDKPNHVMIVKSGAVKFYDIDTDGNEKILHIGGEGSIFPLFYTFEDKESVDAFYSTIAPTEVLLIPLEVFHEKLRTQPGYAFKILRSYAEEMDHMIARLKSLEKSSAKQKIFQALAYMCTQHAKQMSKPNWYRVNFPVTQQLIADLTGLTRETVNVTLNDPECIEFIKTGNKQRLEIQKEAILSLCAQ